MTRDPSSQRAIVAIDGGGKIPRVAGAAIASWLLSSASVDSALFGSNRCDRRNFVHSAMSKLVVFRPLHFGPTFPVCTKDRKMLDAV